MHGLGLLNYYVKHQVLFFFWLQMLNEIVPVFLWNTENWANILYYYVHTYSLKPRLKYEKFDAVYRYHITIIKKENIGYYRNLYNYAF